MTDDAQVRASPGRRRLRPVVLAATVTAAVAASLLTGCSSEDKDVPDRPRTGSRSPEKDDGPGAEPGAFSPYVDTSLKPSYDLLESARRTGVKEYNLAFVSPGGGCAPKWGGRQELADNPVGRQVDALRGKGGDVRVSFGGQSGNELARACGSVDELVNAYTEVIDAYGLTKVDFDIEGPALTDEKANDLRSRAIVRLQQQRAALDVSFTLPAMPAGLNRDALAVLENARENGARVDAVNIMAMDYGTYYDGDMGEYAVKAATATQKQVKSALAIRDEAEAWRTVAVTPMIGVNDVKAEVFKPEDAFELRKFAEEKGLGWLSMWSAARDRPCPGGANSRARATCSSTEREAREFTKAFTG